MFFMLLLLELLVCDYLFYFILFFFNVQVVSAMVTNDLMSLVNTRPLDSWKETLALLCTVRFIMLIKYSKLKFCMVCYHAF